MERATLTVKEAAAVAGVSLPTMYDLTEREDFPLLRIGRKKLILKDQLYTWLAQQAMPQNKRA